MAFELSLKLQKTLTMRWSEEKTFQAEESPKKKKNNEVFLSNEEAYVVMTQ